MKKILFTLLAILFSMQSNAKSIEKSTLATHPYWLKLGHYRNTTFRSWKSEVDSAEFFLSPTGKTSPVDELNATISAFNASKSSQQKYSCQFPARYTWLKSKIKSGVSIKELFDTVGSTLLENIICLYIVLCQ